MRYAPPARTGARFASTRTTTPEYDVAIETNRAGFRDADSRGAPSPASPGITLSRIAVLGDSFVFGSGVARENILTSRLSQSLSRANHPADAWNFGVPGTGPFNDLYIWRDYARKIEPKIVVVALYAGNDASDALRESKQAHPRLVTVARAKMLWYRLRAWWRNRRHASIDSPRVEDAHKAQGWNAFGLDNPATEDALLTAAAERGVPADSVRTRLAAVPDSLVADALAFRSNPFNLAEAVLDPDGLRHNLLLDTPEMNEGWTQVEVALTKLDHDVEKARAQLVLVCIPAAVQVDSSYWWCRNLGFRFDARVLTDTEFQNRLATLAQREGLPLIDLLPVMRAHPNERLYYEQDGHWNANGHAVAAEAIAEKIREMIPRRDVPSGP